MHTRQNPKAIKEPGKEKEILSEFPRISFLTIMPGQL